MAISQYPTGQQGSHRRKRNCLPEIATGAKRPRNDKSGSRCHFNGGPFESAALRRARLSAPLQWPVQFGSAFPRLHPKGTSSRFALRAPRPLRGLAMTNLGALRH